MDHRSGPLRPIRCPEPPHVRPRAFALVDDCNGIDLSLLEHVSPIEWDNILEIVPSMSHNLPSPPFHSDQVADDWIMEGDLVGLTIS